MRVTFALTFGAVLFSMLAADFRPPAGTRSVVKRPGGESIIPGRLAVNFRPDPDPGGWQFRQMASAWYPPTADRAASP